MLPDHKSTEAPFTGFPERDCLGQLDRIPARVMAGHQNAEKTLC
jgi:hypothetical protein